jgi:hypothetical protein
MNNFADLVDLFRIVVMVAVFAWFCLERPTNG